MFYNGVLIICLGHDNIVYDEVIIICHYAVVPTDAVIKSSSKHY